MAEIQEYINIMRSRIKGFKPFLEEAINEAADNIIEDVRDRVESGKNAAGSNFSGYTPKWKATRSKKGKGSTKNFSFTGSLNKSIEFKKKEVSANKITLWIGSDGSSTDDDGRKNKRTRPHTKIIQGHNEHEGYEIFDVSEKEEEKVNKELVIKIEEYFNVK